MGVIKRTRTPCRRRSKTTHGKARSNRRYQRGGVTKAEVFDTVYEETLDRYKKTPPPNYKNLLELLIAREKLSPSIKDIVISSSTLEQIRMNEVANAFRLKKTEAKFKLIAVEEILPTFVVGLKTAFESRYKIDQDKWMDQRISALKSDAASINPMQKRALTDLADMRKLSEQAAAAAAIQAAAAPKSYPRYMLDPEELAAALKAPPTASAAPSAPASASAAPSAAPSAPASASASASASAAPSASTAPASTPNSGFLANIFGFGKPSMSPDVLKRLITDKIRVVSGRESNMSPDNRKKFYELQRALMYNGDNDLTRIDREMDDLLENTRPRGGKTRRKKCIRIHRR
jgi:hypothetical protein